MEKETKDAEKFLVGAMGLDPNVLSTAASKSNVLSASQESLMKPVRAVKGLFGKGKRESVGGAGVGVLSRSSFSTGELDALKTAFHRVSSFSPSTSPNSTTAVDSTGHSESTLKTNDASEATVKKSSLTSLFKDAGVEGYGYENVSEKEVEYVLEEAGFKSRDALDFDEFVEVSSLIYLFFPWVF